jgi:Domain of unknown function (DUF6456)
MTHASELSRASTAAKDLTSRILARLLKNRAALRLRQGRWEVLTADGKGQRAWPTKLSRQIDALIADGSLVRGDDGLLRPSGASAAAVLDVQESPLQRLLQNKPQAGGRYFTSDMMRAGEKLRIDFERAHLRQRVTVNYAMAGGGSSRHWQFSDNAIEKLSDEVFTARQRVHEALDVVGPELSGLLLQVCCLTTGLEAAERQLSLPRRSGKAVLGLALTRLARHYGFRERLRHAGPTRIGHWAVEGYRPQFNPQPPAPHPT